MNSKLLTDNIYLTSIGNIVRFKYYKNDRFYVKSMRLPPNDHYSYNEIMKWIENGHIVNYS